jgi:heterodisulfide reductase subunit A-like polyferredoxin
MVDWAASISHGVYWVGCMSSYGEVYDSVNSCNAIAAEARLICGASQIVPYVLRPQICNEFVQLVFVFEYLRKLQTSTAL